MNVVYTTADGKQYTAADGTVLVLAAQEFVTDRTQNDVERWRILRNKGWSAMTESEQREWMGTNTPTFAAWKGMYTHNDLNRVESAVESIVELLKEAGYKPPELVTKTNWTYTDTISRSDVVRYLENVSSLRKCIKTYPTTPMAPTVGVSIDYKKANDIEKILEDIYNISTNLMKSWYCAGELICGEV